MRVLFWGTPAFAVPPLRALLGEGFEVCGVVTQPDRPQGRARRVVESPVKRVALAEKIPVFQPETLREEEFEDMARAIAPDISVVVAYGQILSEELIQLPRLGTVNIHASLLPALRGAAPLQAALRAGLRETGVTIMRMVRALDAGPIIRQARTPVADDETYGELQLRLSELGALALVEALTLLSVGAARETPQDDSLATYAPKVDRETARIGWNLTAREVANIIRAYDPTPGAHSPLKGADVKLFGARLVQSERAGAPGEVISVADGLVVACGDGGAVRVANVQPSGRTRMPAREWARGRGVAAGERFGA